eukprot:gene1435-2783_t
MPFHRGVALAWAGCSVAAASFDEGDNCTALNKQKALYLGYTFDPPLASDPPLDMSVDHLWVS